MKIKLLSTFTTVLFMGLAVNAAIQTYERLDDKLLISGADRWFLVNYPEMDQFEDVTAVLDFTSPRYIHVIATHGPNFILADFNTPRGDGNKFYLFNPVTKSIEHFATVYGELEYQFRWKQFHVFTSHLLGIHVLDSEKMIFTHETIKNLHSMISLPDEEGIFWELPSNRMSAQYPSAIFQFQLNDNGIVSTGVESDIIKGDLASSLNGGTGAIGYLGQSIAVSNGLIYDIETGEHLGSSISGYYRGSGDGYIFTQNFLDLDLVMRSWDGSKVTTYSTNDTPLIGLIEDEDAYSAYYWVQEYGLNKELMEIYIPKIVPTSSNAITPVNQYPKSPFRDATIAPMDSTSFMYQIPLAEGGIDVAIVNIPERKIEASLKINKPLRHTPFYDPLTNALWFQGYELSLREIDKYKFNWRFDANSSSLNNFFKLGNRIYFEGFPSGYYDLTSQEVVPTEFPATRHDNLLAGPTGEIYTPRGTHMEVFDSEVDFIAGSPEIINTPLHRTGGWTSNNANTLWANAFGQIFRNGDIQNLFTLDPFVQSDLDEFSPIAVQDERIYRLSKAPSTPESTDEITWLHVWNNDGSRHSRTPLPPTLLAPIYDEVPHGINWDILSTGNQLFLLGYNGMHEVFLFDFDEQLGEILGLDNPVAARLSYQNSYDSYPYGRIYEVDDNWKYSPDNGWIFLPEHKDHYIEWMEPYGFIARPKYSSTYLYTYNEGWKAWFEQIDGYDWYYDFNYRYRESNFPSLAPHELVGRHIHVYDSTGRLLEYWNINSESTANLTFFDLSEPGPYQIPITYLNPLIPGNNVVQVEFDPNNFLNVGGFYEFDFLTKFEGNLRSDLTVPDPDRPGWYINVKSEGTFKIVTPEKGPASD